MSNAELNPELAWQYVRDYNYMNNVLALRESLINGGFWDQETINKFVELFSQAVKIDSYEVNYSGFTIQMKLHMTKKKHNLYNALYFYPIIGSVMKSLINWNSLRFMQIVTSAKYYDIYSKIINDERLLCNLCNVQCIGSDVIQIVL